MRSPLTWHDILAHEKRSVYFINILNAIAAERQAGWKIYPPQKEIFNAFLYTKLTNIKVVILGQDPYHHPGQAHGLAFSVRPGIRIPPSLLNIYKELENTVTGFSRPYHGCLESWAHQGVFLLNTVLTVREGQANSHSGLGWKIFTNNVISLISKFCEKIVFLLWGSCAQKQGIIDHQRHYVLKAPHPSPLSAHRGFFGCNHFILANEWLEKHNKKPIDWMPILPPIGDKSL